MSALLETPRGDLEPDGGVSDHKLVAAVRRGDDRAFEALYGRYHRRIHAYVLGMVKDHQRAEDVTQEVFVSALRRMRATERPIAFKPWVYEIAKNACIDQFRRSKRAEEVSYNAEDGLAPSDYTRLVSNEPVPEKALDSKQQLDHLCGAFGGLSDAHHEILVLRELEGLSYREIGERMGMSRPAVESTLFRARRRLTEEYDELASGQRCVRIQSIIAGAGSGRLGARDTRRLARHVAHCQPCRRQALAAGVVDPAAVARRPLRNRAIEKVAGFFPLPFMLRGRDWMAQLPLFGDQAAGGAKAAAVAAVVIAGLGAGVGTQVGGADDGPPKSLRPAAEKPAAASKPEAKKPAAVPAATLPAAAPAEKQRSAPAPKRSAKKARIQGADRKATVRRGTSSPAKGRSRPQQAPASQPPASRKPSAPATKPASDIQKSAPSTPSSPAPTVQLPLPSAPTGGQNVDPGPVVNGVTQGLQQTVQQVQTTLDTTVNETVPKVTQPVTDLLGGLGG